MDPRKVSTVTSVPQSTSTTALNTSPVFPLRLCTATSLASIRLKLDACVLLSPESFAIVDAVNGRTDTGFQDEDVDEDKSARK